MTDDSPNIQNPAPEAAPTSELDACRKERDEYLAGWQRAKADFINYKKEEARRLEEMAKFQAEDILFDLIGVLDNFSLAIAALEKQGPVERGVYMIRTQLEDLMKRRGLARIAIAIGEPFDPSVAEAIAEGESEHPPGSVIQEIEAGYRLHNRVLRPARVKVSRQI